MIHTQEGKMGKVYFKYERLELQDFCYVCVWLGHVIKDYSNRDDAKEDDDTNI